MRNSKVEPASHPAEQSLARCCERRQPVWLDYRNPYDGYVESRLVELRYINNRGRLFISDRALWDNWGYGCDRMTGEVRQMQHYKMLLQLAISSGGPVYQNRYQ
jgi:hypothetical protein